MTHEGHDALSHCCLYVGLVVQCLSQHLGITLFCHQRGTHHHVLVETLHVGIGKVAVAVVHEVLHITVAHTTILLTRDDLQRLYHHLLIACQADGREPVLRIVVIFRIDILTGTGIVDTNG